MACSRPWHSIYWLLTGPASPRPSPPKAGVVGAEQAGIGTRRGHADGIAGTVHRREVAHCHQGAALLVLAEERNGIGLVVVGLDPLKALPGEVQLPQLRVGQVEGVDRLEERLKGLVAVSVLPSSSSRCQSRECS